MREAVICEPLRTPVGRYGGVFRDVPPASSRRPCIARAACERTGLPGERGRRRDPRPVLPERRGARDRPGRRARRRPARRGAAACSSTAAAARGCRRSSTPRMQVQTGAATSSLAGGAESMSKAEFYSIDMRWGGSGAGVELHDRAGARPRDRRRREPPGAGRHAGDRREPAPRVRDLARGAGRARAALPPARGRRAAGRALRRGDRPGRPCRAAEGRDRRRHATSTRAPTPRSRSSRKLRPVLARRDPEATVTAGNASGQNDGAAVCIVTTPERAAELGLRPLVRLVSWAVAGVRARDHGHRPGARPPRRRWSAPA